MFVCNRIRLTNVFCYANVKKMKKIIFLLILFSLSQNPVFAFWVRDARSGKWVNPKYAVKETPKEQLDLAISLYELKRYPEAKREFKKLLNAYPKAKEAAEAQYYLGLVEEAQGNLYEAYQAYQRVVTKYPFSERIQEIIERQYKIAEAFMSGYKRKAMGMPLPVENPAIEIFTKVVENSTYGPLAAKAQYKLGLVLKSLMRYSEAEEAFNKVITNYPDSEWVEAARFQVASCKAAASRGVAYDQEMAKEAKAQFEEFVREHPDAVLSRDAEKQVSLLNEREAEGSYSVGLFYEKQKAYQSARIYYNEVINKYPNTSWAAKSLERLQIIDKKNK